MRNMKFTIEAQTAAFNRDILAFIREAGISADKVIRKTAFDLLAMILRPPPLGKHPVDTGRARAAWYASMNGLGMNFDLSQGLSSKSQVDKGKREGDFIEHLGPEYKQKWVELVNGCPYIVYLEYGHSKLSAPYGMVRVSIRKMRGSEGLPWRMGKAYREAWNKFDF